MGAVDSGFPLNAGERLVQEDQHRLHEQEPRLGPAKVVTLAGDGQELDRPTAFAQGGDEPGDLRTRYVGVRLTVDDQQRDVDLAHLCWSR